MGINVSDRVRIVRVGADEKQLLHKLGRVMFIADGANCLVVLDDGTSAEVNINQLEKV